MQERYLRRINMVVKTYNETLIDVEKIEFNVDNTVNLIFKDKSKKNIPVIEITSIKSRRLINA
jgi:hypothetical protein